MEEIRVVHPRTDYEKRDQAHDQAHDATDCLQHEFRFSLFGHKPKQLETFVKGGAFFWTADSQASRTSRKLHNDGFLFLPVLGTRFDVETDYHSSGVSPVLGFGLDIGLYRGLALRVEAEVVGDVGEGRRLVDVEDPGDPSSPPLVIGMETATSAVSLGLRYRFGDPRR